MFLIDRILLLTGLLVFLGIWSSKLSSRIGVPGLVIFLLIGMLAGSEGIGRIAFESYGLAHAVGTVALALILFDGGLRTSSASIRAGWKPAGVLATVGVFTTAGITGLAAAWLLDLPLLHGLLLGSIVGSTDAAAVFALLKGRGLKLNDRLSATLEIESGSNDPMAIFLTVGCIQLITSDAVGLGSLMGLFGLQMGVGAAVGLGMGVLGAAIINRINLDSAGLYPVLAGAIGIASFGLAAELQGSGFLAVYLTGVAIGNKDVVFRRGIYLFHDGAAWTGQIVMFTMLGLLVFPSSLTALVGPGLLIAAVLILVARPVTVFLFMAPFGFSFRELVFLSWIGLKGAVPIMLAIFPLLFGVDHGRLIFDIVFFMVIVSALTQGWSLPLVARRLGLNEKMVPEPHASLEISSLKHVDAEIVEYHLPAESPVIDRPISELPLPAGVLIAMVTRNQRALPPGGGTVLREGDYVFVVLQRDLRPYLDRLFSGEASGADDFPAWVHVSLRPTIRVADIEHFYRIELGVPSEKTLVDVLRASLDHPLDVGDTVDFDGWTLGVKSLNGRACDAVFLMKREPRTAGRRDASA